MWLLTVRRTNSNDIYDLLKPPVVTSTLFVLLLLIMTFLDTKLPFTFSEQEFVAYVPFPAFIITGMILPFIGVAISEIIYRAKA